MPLQELRTARFARRFSQLRPPWPLPAHIFGPDDSRILLSRSFTTSPAGLVYVPIRRSDRSSASSAIPHLKPDPDIVPGSLERTLEAHRNTNRSPVIHKYFIDDVTSQHAGILRLDLPDESSNQREDDLRYPKQKPSKRGAGGNGSKPSGGRRATQSRYTDYEGVSQLPKNEWSIGRRDAPYHEVKPWLAHLDRIPKGSDNVFDSLTAEIVAFGKYMEPTAMEKAAADIVLAAVRKVLQAIDPAIQSSVIGSRGTGLAMPLSDIDIHIKPPKPETGRTRQAAARTQVIELLGKVARRLRKQGGPKPTYQQPILIKARVPIVRARHASTGLELQLQSATDGHTSMELVKAYMDEYPTLRPLFLVLRQVIKMRGMGEPRLRGLGSYTLIMMIVAALKLSCPRFDRGDAGRQLLYILDFYSKLDFLTTGIIVDPPQLFSKLQHSGNARSATNAKVRGALTFDGITLTQPVGAPPHLSASRPLHPYAMYLQDPANASNDLGHQAGVIRHVQATFETLRRKTEVTMGLFEKRSTGYEPFSLLDPCLAGDYRAYEKMRKRIRLAGEKSAGEPLVAGYL